jgi:AMME syndrome candidate gene 1 protein
VDCHGRCGRRLITLWYCFTFDSPLFVTWSTRSSRPGRASRLRGCIGNFEAMPLREGIAEYALISAFRDSRFNKIQEWELETLECE